MGQHSLLRQSRHCAMSTPPAGQPKTRRNPRGSSRCPGRAPSAKPRAAAPRPRLRRRPGRRRFCPCRRLCPCRHLAVADTAAQARRWQIGRSIDDVHICMLVRFDSLLCSTTVPEKNTSLRHRGWPDFAEFGQVWSKSRQVLPMPGHFGPKSAKFCPRSVETRCFAELGADVVEFGPSGPELGRTRPRYPLRLDRRRSNFGRIRVRVGRNWSKSGKTLRAGFQRNSADVGPARTGIDQRVGPASTEHGRVRTKLGHPGRRRDMDKHGGAKASPGGAEVTASQCRAAGGRTAALCGAGGGTATVSGMPMSERGAGRAGQGAQLRRG